MKETGKQRYRVLLLAVLMAGMLCSMTVLAEETVRVCYRGTLGYDQAREVYSLVNMERTKAGLGTLVQNKNLQQAAMLRAMELGLHYSHTRPNGTRGLDIVPDKAGTRAENIACGQASASVVMTQWMNSDGHKANILNANLRQIGVGCFYQNGTWYWVQLFNGGTAESSFGTGSVPVQAEVDVLPSMLDLSFAVDGSVVPAGSTCSAEENEAIDVVAVHRNRGTGGWLPLIGVSAGLDWSVSGSGLTMMPSESTIGMKIQPGQIGTGKAVTVTCGEYSWKLPIDVVHIHKPNGISCVQDVYCSTCGELLEKKQGHDKPLWHECPDWYVCSRCMERIEGHPHVPGPEATCQRNQYCQECGKLLAGRRSCRYTTATCTRKSYCIWCGDVSGDYAAHQWSAWKTVAKATTQKAEQQKRSCAVCGREQTRSVGSKLPANAKVKSVRITGKTSVLAGRKITLKAAVSPSYAKNKALTWKSSNTKYATVSSKGVVSAKSVGAGHTVTITAKAKDGSKKLASFRLKIKPPVKKITLKASKTLRAGRSLTVKATVSVGKGGSKALSWTSSSTRYAAVSAKGVVKAKAAGKGHTVTVTAKAKDGSGKKASVRIKIR